jgi:hypothetical protein
MDRLEIHDNFLGEDLFHECSTLSNKVYPENKTVNIHTHFRLNVLAWDNNVVLDSSHILIYDINNKENEILFNKLKIFIESKIKRPLKSIVFVFYTPCSHIPFHDDSCYNGSVTIYLNEYWDRNHGGFYMFELNNELRAIVPKKNMGIIQYGGNTHSVSCTTKMSPIRRSIQCFF